MEYITATTIFLASLNMSAQDQGFAYNTKTTGNVVTSEVVYKKHEGKYLHHHLTYNYTYDEQQRLTKKEVLKWNAAQGKWERSHCLHYAYNPLGYSIEYALWNRQGNAYSDVSAKQVYDESLPGTATVALYKWNKNEKNWTVQNNVVVMNPESSLLASLEAEPEEIE